MKNDHRVEHNASASARSNQSGKTRKTGAAAEALGAPAPVAVNGGGGVSDELFHALCSLESVKLRAVAVMQMMHEFTAAEKISYNPRREEQIAKGLPLILGDLADQLEDVFEEVWEASGMWKGGSR